MPIAFPRERRGKSRRHGDTIRSCTCGKTLVHKAHDKNKAELEPLCRMHGHDFDGFRSGFNIECERAFFPSIPFVAEGFKEIVENGVVMRFLEAFDALVKLLEQAELVALSLLALSTDVFYITAFFRNNNE